MKKRVTTIRTYLSIRFLHLEKLLAVGLPESVFPPSFARWLCIWLSHLCRLGIASERIYITRSKKGLKFFILLSNMAV